MKLNLGAGNKKIDGFLSVDLRKLSSTDIVEDISLLSSIEDESCEELVAQHIIEHFPHHKILYLLYNWWRVLKPEGILSIETPNLLWIINEFNKEYSGEGNLVNRRRLVNFLYGGQEYQGNYHNNIFDIDTLAHILTQVGFDFKFISGGIQDQNIRVICKKKVVDLSKYDEIWINSRAKVFGDRLLSYPIALVFKYYYPDKKVSLVTKSEVEEDLYFCANGIDGTIYNPFYPLIPMDRMVRVPDEKVFVVDESFDVDTKWAPWKYGIKDGPEVWQKMIEEGLNAEIPIGLLGVEKYDEKFKRIYDLVWSTKLQSNYQYTVCLFIDSYRPNMSLPWEISHWGYDKHYQLCKSMNHIQFITFYGPKDIPHPKFNLPNVIELGEINAVEQLYLFKLCDLLVSISTSVSAMIAPMSQIPIIVLNSQGINNESVWAGIPDKCVLPPERYRHLFHRKDDITFLKPLTSEYRYLWQFNSYWCGVVKEREMLPVSDISVQQVSNAITNRLNGRKAYEVGLQPGNICNSCQLNKEMGLCIYHHHKSSLESGN